MPEDQNEVRHLSVIESRAWAVAALLTIVGTGLIVSTAPEIGVLAFYNAGLACVVILSNVVMGALGFRYQRTALREVGAVLDDVEDELAKRRHR